MRTASREFVGKDIDLGKLTNVVDDFFKADKHRTQRDVIVIADATFVMHYKT